MNPPNPAESFIASFQKNDQYIYRDKLLKAILEQKALYVDFQDIMMFGADLAKQCIEHPRETLELMKRAAISTLLMDNPNISEIDAQRLKVRITNLPDVLPIRAISVALLGKLFATQGVVIRVSERKNFLIRAAFQDEFNHIVFVDQVDETLDYPSACTVPDCEGRSWTFIQEQSTFIDYQRVRIQEVGDDLPAGQIPRGYDVVMTEDLIDAVRPGDEVVIVGILRAVRERGIGTSRTRVFASEIECISVQIKEKEKDASQLTDNDIAKIKEIAQQPDAYSRLVNSIAPSIIGHNDIKEAILLQLVGGNSMIFPDGTRRRGDIHILLCGDPSTSKSELLQFTSRVAVRGILASGKGSTAAGLSAGLVKQGDTMYLEVGVLPLADQGFAVIDELDKMRPEDRSALHEAMEQQTITYNKGGFHVVLNARASILAALNPVAGVYDPTLSFVENVRLPPTLISRFDLLTIMRDVPNPEHDAELARHILEEHKRANYTTEPPLSFSMLKKYILYARTYIKPKLTDEATQVLENYYIELRKMSTPNQIPITPRTLESLIRLATARAKILLRDQVTKDDAEIAVSLMKRMFAEVLTDPTTKALDTAILAGVSGKMASRETIALKVVRDLAKQTTDGIIPRTDIKDALIKAGLEEEIADRMIRWLYERGRIYEAQPGKFKLVSI